LNILICYDLSLKGSKFVINSLQVSTFCLGNYWFSYIYFNSIEKEFTKQVIGNEVSYT